MPAPSSPADQSKGSTTGAFVPRPSTFVPGPPTGMPLQPSFAPPRPPSSPGGSTKGADGTLAEQGGPALFKPFAPQDAGPGSAAAAAAAAAAEPKAAAAATARQGAYMLGECQRGIERSSWLLSIQPCGYFNLRT